jgi:hypothetical protein
MACKEKASDAVKLEAIKAAAAKANLIFTSGRIGMNLF